MKADDCFAIPACTPCHRELDQGKTLTREERETLWMEGWIKTVKWLFESRKIGLISTAIGVDDGEK